MMAWKDMLTNKESGVIVSFVAFGRRLQLPLSGVEDPVLTSIPSTPERRSGGATLEGDYSNDKSFEYCQSFSVTSIFQPQLACV